MKNPDKIFSLKNRIIIITGAAGLLGQEHANSVAMAEGIPILIDINKEKVDNLAKELVENYLRASRKSFLDMGYCFYLFLFRVLQRMIFQFSYPVYRHYLKATCKEILNNHKEWLHEFKEWDKAPTEGNLIGEKKKDSDNDTLH